MSPLQGVFKRRYGSLTGRDWIKTIDPEDRRALIEDGMQAWQRGKLGGIARAQTARRSPGGKFVKADGSYTPRGGFREQVGREPEAWRDYNPDAELCQDDYEFFSSTGRYAVVKHGKA